MITANDIQDIVHISISTECQFFFFLITHSPYPKQICSGLEYGLTLLILYQTPVWDCSYGCIGTSIYFQLRMTARSSFQGHIINATVQQALIIPEVTFVQLVYSPKQICSGLLLLVMRTVTVNIAY